MRGFANIHRVTALRADDAQHFRAQLERSMSRSVPGVGEGAVIAGMGHKKQKKERRRPGSQHAEEHRSARAAPKRDLPLINIESQRDCTAH